MITQAMILAAGRGERMRPLTLTTPKPLLAVGGKPLIVWHIERLRRAGIERIVINAGYLANKLSDFFAIHDFGVQIVLSLENPPLETAGGIKQALTNKLLAPAPFILINGDIWCDYPLENLTNITLQDHLGYLLLTDNPDHNPTGDFVLTTDGSGRVVPKSTKPLPSLTFAGVSVLDPALFAGVPCGQIAPLAPLLQQAMHAQKIIGSRLDGYWIDVGTVERLQIINAYLADKND